MAMLNPKVVCLFKLTQAQKTQHVINQIKDDIEDDPNTFFVFISHNFTNAKDQTIGRIMENGFNPIVLASDDGDNCVASASDASVMCAMDDSINGICMLAHSIRFKTRRTLPPDIYVLLATIQNLARVSRIMVYFDEFDGYSSILTNHLDRMCSYEKVERFELFSATWRDCPYIKKLADIPVHQRLEIEESYDPSMYYTYDELHMNKRIEVINNDSDWFETAITYLVATKAVIERDMYAFVPAMHKKKSHFDVASRLNEHGFDVVVLNSDFKGIQTSSGARFDLDTTIKEPARAILTLKQQIGATHLVVTGNACIGRAVTLQDEGLVFDIAVYHHCMTMTGDQLYQLDRTKGNIKRFGSKIPFIVCTKKALRILKSRERCAMLNTEGADMTIKQFAKEADRLAKESIDGPKTHRSLVPCAIEFTLDEIEKLKDAWGSLRKKSDLCRAILISRRSGFDLDNYIIKTVTKTQTLESWKKKIKAGRKHADDGLPWDFENNVTHVVANQDTVIIYVIMDDVSGADEWRGMVVNRMVVNV